METLRAQAGRKPPEETSGNVNLGQVAELGKNLPGGDNYSRGGPVGSKQEDYENIKASKEVSCIA